MFHTGYKSETFSCFLCDAEGFTQDAMEQHLQFVHGAPGGVSNSVKPSANEESQQQEAFCMLCDFNIPSQQTLQAHIRTEHLEQNTCPLCDIVFTKAEEAERHILTDHADLIDGLGCGEAAADDAFLYDNREMEDTEQETSFSERPVSDQDSHHQSLRLSDCPQSSPVNAYLSDGESEVILVHESFEEKEADKKCMDGDAAKQETECSSNIPIILGMEKDTVNNNDGLKSSTQRLQQNQDTKPESSKSYVVQPSSVSLASVTTSNTSSVNETKQSTNNLLADKTFWCPFCSFQTVSESAINHHVNTDHLTQDAFLDGLQTSLLYTCPFCDNGFDNPTDLAQHVNTEHPEKEIGGGSSMQEWVPPSPANGRMKSGGQGMSRLGASSNSKDHECPVCGLVIKQGSAALLAAHVNEHFQSNSNTSFTAPEDQDRKLAEKLQDQERKKEQKETHSFKQVQSQFGMDTSMTAKQQFERNLEKAVTSGQLTVVQAHDQKVQQTLSDQSGVDDGSTCVVGIIGKLQAYYRGPGCPKFVSRVYLCNSASHFSSSFGDKGWGCGYRNFQMLLSCLVNDATYLQVLFNGVNKIPSIKKLQHLIERAWQAGYDPQGCAQLGGRVINTRKWIGATEIVATLSSLRIKCQLLDFHAPSGPDNTHPTMLNWVRDYFKNSTGFTPPLYLQHQGHSRTIIGVEELRNGEHNLLLFDPGTAKPRMQQFHGVINYNTMQAIRKTLKAFRARQYQIVAVMGMLNDREMQASKLVRSIKLS